MSCIDQDSDSLAAYHKYKLDLKLHREKIAKEKGLSYDEYLEWMNYLAENLAAAE